MVAIAGSTKLCCSILMFSLSPGRAAEASSERAIDTGRSAVTVRALQRRPVFFFWARPRNSGLIKDGAFDEEKNTVWFLVEARSLQIRDSEASEKDRAEIQNTTLGQKVLDSEKI
jgi:hypothetical protein